MKGEIDAMAEQVFQAVKAFIALSVGKVSGRVDLIEQTVKSIPAPLKGDPGQAGTNGSDGKSAYQLAIERGFDGTEKQWLESLRGKAGEPVNHELVLQLISSGVEKAVREIPPPLDGQRGPEGPKGDIGTEGPRGEIGIEGKQGPIGERGADGIGSKGDPGEPGQSAYQLALAKGYDGTEKQWLASLRGEKGETGSFGGSAFEIAKETGFTGNVQEWLASLRGKDGADGINGKDGSNGINGKDGANALNGKDGASAFEIAKGHGFAGSEFDWVESLRGKQGPPGIGKDGRDGRETVDGRDALELDVLDGIDETRSYPRSTYASFGGGTFRAARATDPLKGKGPLEAGWQCIVRGLSSEKEEWEDSGRFITKTIIYSDGTQLVSRKQTAIPIYRGVYQAGKKYLPGDGVTFDGGQWTAKAETTERPRSRPPGDEQVWQLSLKAEVRNPR